MKALWPGFEVWYGNIEDCSLMNSRIDRGSKHSNHMSKEKPVHEVRIGAIKAAIWRNTTPSGIRFNVTFGRLYKDGDDWKATDSFGRDDLLVLAKVADKAHSWIHEQGHQEDGDDNGKRSARK